MKEIWDLEAVGEFNSFKPQLEKGIPGILRQWSLSPDSNHAGQTGADDHPAGCMFISDIRDEELAAL